MKNNKKNPKPSINNLVSRREAILINWRMKREADTLFRKLADEPLPTDPITIASEHGLHRWQSGVFWLIIN
jgi:hypothetical protein